MQCEWLGERVATVDVPRAISNVVHGREDAGWGPNAVFRFPKRGGTGAVWKGVAALLPAERQVRGRCSRACSSCTSQAGGRLGAICCLGSWHVGCNANTQS